MLHRSTPPAVVSPARFFVGTSGLRRRRPSVADFYPATPSPSRSAFAGRQLRLYPRVFARYMGKSAGNPTVIVQNMPGAGRCARQLQLQHRSQGRHRAWCGDADA